jgi:chromosome segregation ATPase
MAENSEIDEKRVNAMISRAALKLAATLLGTASIALLAWGGWMSNAVIELGNSRAANESSMRAFDARLLVVNERMNIMQQDIQQLSQDTSALRGEYEEIKRQLRKSGNWPAILDEPASRGGRPRAAAVGH